MGAGVLRREAKSNPSPRGAGSKVGVFSGVGEPGSDRMEDTERRLVRAGVLTGNTGGALEPEEFVRGGDGQLSL